MPKKILVIDDEPSIRMVLQSRLAKMDYAVLTAKDGLVGLEITRSARPDLIILDVLMPELTGYQFVEKLRNEHEDIRRIPIIVISAKYSMRDFFPDWAILTFLQKPLEPDTIVDTIRDAIGLPDEDAVKTAPVSETVPLPVAAGNGKIIIVVAVEKAILDRVRTHLEVQGYTVINGVNEERALQMIRDLKPALVLGQYWEDLTILDTTMIYRTMQDDPTIQAIPFAVFSREHLGLDAKKMLQPARVLIYKQSEDLAATLDHYLQESA
ncbi:MAG: response regulator [Candidatus Omnitrophota bacterium]|nr:response regulator [Candidatus Omnitrophota bacterium]